MNADPFVGDQRALRIACKRTPFHIRIDLGAPRFSKSTEVNAAAKDAPLAVRTAFREAGRRLDRPGLLVALHAVFTAVG